MRGLMFLMLIAACTLASGQTYKALPPAGVEIDATIKQRLQQRVDRLRGQIEVASKRSADGDQWEPDVWVLGRAVELALQQNLFFKAEQTADAERLLDEAERRLVAAGAGDRGLKLMGLAEKVVSEPQMLVGGFVSQIDGSVQPYGLVLPAGFDRDSSSPWRLDIWLHGRGDTKTEIPFLRERMTKPGQYTPNQAIVLHPFGRHCNAFKFAGETDVYESIAHCQSLVRIDPRQVVIRGFSMGGAGCWHFAAHDPGNWMAANPGAGFVDTIVYQGWDKRGYPFPIDDTREKLLNWYDVLPWTRNLSNTNVIAYSGEVDKQKQAADRVLAASTAIGLKWDYVIGKGMGHKIDPDSATQIGDRLDEMAAMQRDGVRQRIDFTTFTLRYHHLDWLQILGLVEHWQPGRVQAEITGDRQLRITSSGVTRIKLDFRETPWPANAATAELIIDGQTIEIDDWDRAAGIQCELKKHDAWQVVEVIDSSLRKKPGLQGPIDDAFCDRFVFVLPTRPARHGIVQRWMDREIAYAQDRWQRLMRGKVNVVTDQELTADQIANCHLICFGDFSSNQYLAKWSEQLPIQWTDTKLQVGDRTFDPATHAAVMCYPNPENPDRYLVINSGMTFREFSNVSNSRQIAMLPDWAVLDVSSSEEDGIYAGKIAVDGFFDEQWGL